MVNFEVQENKVYYFGIYYHSGRPKPFRFIIQIAKEREVLSLGESFIRAHQIGLKGMIDNQHFAWVLI